MRQDLYYCDVSSFERSGRERREGIHAASYLYVAAALEATVTEMLGAVVDEVNQAALRLCDIRPSLLTIASAPHLVSLQDVRGLKMWLKRVETFAILYNTESCVLSSENLPLDGRTIRADHLSTAWNVFGFGGPHIPGPLHRLALKDLADTRNELAHGGKDASEVAGARSVEGTLRLIERIEQVVTHIWSEASDYLDRAGYRR